MGSEYRVIIGEMFSRHEWESNFGTVSGDWMARSQALHRSVKLRHHRSSAGWISKGQSGAFNRSRMFLS